MSKLFISHSSQNNFEALALKEWLKRKGWADVFLDIDSERGIVAGKRWRAALHEAADRCKAVLFCISQDWLDSEWCREEFKLAIKHNKFIFGLIVKDIDMKSLPEELTSNWQFVDLASGVDHELIKFHDPKLGDGEASFSANELNRLKAGLVNAGLDPDYFEWPPEGDHDRSPYPGMSHLETDDAGIFFGREGPTIELLAKLRGFSAKQKSGLMVILGASGAGKSSFLRAGIFPRLERDDRNFLTLPVIRPEKSVLWGKHGFLNSLSTGFKQDKQKISRGDIREILKTSIENETIELIELIELLHKFIEQNSIPSFEDEKQFSTPTLVLPIDQGEELFQSEGIEDANIFLKLINQLINHSKLSIIILFTIRAVDYDLLQTHEKLKELEIDGFLLNPMPIGSFKSVIEGPASCLRDNSGIQKFTVTKGLTEQLLNDVGKGGGSDALPLLAFTLRRLYEEYHTVGKITEKQYEKMGGMEGAINAAIEIVITDAVDDRSLPDDREAIKQLLRRGLIPWLVGIDPNTGELRRKVAKLSEIPSEAMPVIDQLIQKRLLSKDVNEEDKETTIEPVHEALLRLWGMLDGWLKEDLPKLTILDSIQRARLDWVANTEDKDYLVHSAGRLIDTKQLTEDPRLKESLKPKDWEYLEQCRELEEQKKSKELKAAKKFAVVTTLSLIVVIILFIFSVYKGWQANKELVLSNHNFALVLNERAIKAFQEKRFSEAAYYSAKLQTKTQSKKLRAKANSLWVNSVNKPSLAGIFEVTGSLYNNNLTFSKDDSTLAYGEAMSDDIYLWDVATGKEKIVLSGHGGDITGLSFSSDGLTLASGAIDNTIRIWDISTGKVKAILNNQNIDGAICFLSGNSTLAYVSGKTIQIIDISTGKVKLVLKGHKSQINSLSFSSSESTLVSGSDDMTIRLWDLNTGKKKAIFAGHTSRVTSVNISSDGVTLASGSDDKTVRIWDIVKGIEREVLKGHTEAVTSVSLSSNGLSLVSGSYDKTIIIWDVVKGKEKSILRGGSSDVSSVKLSADGLTIASVQGSNIYLWDVSTSKESILFPHAKTSLVSLSSDGFILASVSIDNNIQIWDVDSGKEIYFISLNNSVVTSLSLSSNGLILAISFADNTIQIWDIKAGKEKVILKGHTSKINSLSFSSNDSILASGSDDKTIRLWDVNTGKVKATLKGHRSNITSLSFSSDDLTLASIGENNDNIYIWDVRKGIEKSLLSSNYPYWFQHINFSSKGITLISYSAVFFDRKGIYQAATLLWDVEAKKEKAILMRIDKQPYLNFVEDVSLSSDASVIATIYFDTKNIYIWNAEQFIKINNDKFRNKWIHEYEQFRGFDLDGLDITYNNFSMNNIPPKWSKSHPYNWLQSANQGDSEAMFQLGIIAHRNSNKEKAKHWYNKALNAGHPKAKYRLMVLEQTL